MATKRTKPRSPRGAKRRAENPEIRRAAERAGIAEPPGAWQLSGPAFDGGEDIRRDSTAADLFALVFAADPGADGLLDGAIQCAIDDFELIECAISDEENLSDLLRRVAMRANHRLKVACEVDRRMRAAGVSS